MDSNYSALIEEMTNMIIRPHRDTYLPDKLGPSHLIVKSKITTDQHPPAHKYLEVVRKDLVLELKGQKIQLSLFSPVESATKSTKGGQRQGQRRCVVYLHANSGSRVEGLELVKYVLPFGWSMALFDYRGSGISDGDYTSMGVNESEDLQKIIHYLSGEHFSEFSLWGRSMGAVTILYYLTKQYYSNYKGGVLISSIVLDSPFSNMRKLMYEIGANNVGLPQFVFLPVVNSITQQLISKMGFNLISELDLVARVRQIREKYGEWEKVLTRVSCLFLTSTQDKLVNHSHVELLHREFPFGVKELHYFSGQHNESRADTLKLKCAEFLCQSKGMNEEDRWRLGSPYIKSNPTMRRSEIPRQPAFEENRKEGLMPPPLLKNDPCSPKLKRNPHQPQIKRIPHQLQNKRIPQQPQKPQPSKSQTNNFDNPRRQEQQAKTIIINNNFNVNLNVYSKGGLEMTEIPPINLKEQGSMTDRLSDNHNYNFKFYMPYTAKVERKNYDLQGSSISNVSSFSNSSAYNNSLHSSSYIDQQTVEKEPLYHSAKIEHQGPRMSHPICQAPKESPRQIQNLGLKQQKELNHIEIPLIKFDQIDSNTPKPYMISRKDKPESKFTTNSPKAGECFLSKKDPQAAQKQKLSLSQLRKIQKQVQQKSDLKTSKVLYTNKQKGEKQQQLLNYKKEDIFQDTQVWKYKSEQNAQTRGRQSKDMKSMKTSLMAKRKVYDRKNSDHVVGGMKYSQLRREENAGEQSIGQVSQPGQGGQVGQYERAGLGEKEGVNSQKRLLYKIKIDHL